MTNIEKVREKVEALKTLLEDEGWQHDIGRTLTPDTRQELEVMLNDGKKILAENNKEDKE